MSNSTYLGEWYRFSCCKVRTSIRGPPGYDEILKIFRTRLKYRVNLVRSIYHTKYYTCQYTISEVIQSCLMVIFWQIRAAVSWNTEYVRDYTKAVRMKRPFNKSRQLSSRSPPRFRILSLIHRFALDAKTTKRGCDPRSTPRSPSESLRSVRSVYFIFINSPTSCDSCEWVRET